MSDERRGNLETRYNDDGTLDEVVMYDAAGKCIFHLEQMSDSCFWMRWEGNEAALVVNIFAKQRIGPAEEEEDEEFGNIAANVEWEPKL